jgi:hypothetical protein
LGGVVAHIAGGIVSVHLDPAHDARLYAIRQ